MVPTLRQVAEGNWLLQSIMKVLREPERQIQPVLNASAIVSVLISGIENTLGHLVKISVAVSTHDILSFDLGREPTRSSWMSAKRAAGWNGCSIGV